MAGKSPLSSGTFVPYCMDIRTGQKSNRPTKKRWAVTLRLSLENFATGPHLADRLAVEEYLGA